MTMSRKKRTATVQEVRSLLSEIDEISQQRWDELDKAGLRPDDSLLLTRNFLKTLKQRNEICRIN